MDLRGFGHRRGWVPRVPISGGQNPSAKPTENDKKRALPSDRSGASGIPSINWLR